MKARQAMFDFEALEGADREESSRTSNQPLRMNYPCADMEGRVGEGLVGPRDVAKQQRANPQLDRPVHIADAVADVLKEHNLPDAPGSDQKTSPAADQYVDRFNVYDFTRPQMPWLVPCGSPLFRHYRSFTDRIDQVEKYLKKTDTILNSRGGIKILRDRTHKQQAIRMLQGLFYHYPYQTLDLIAGTLPSKQFDVSRTPVFRVREGSEDRALLFRLTADWIAKYPHVMAEAKSWVENALKSDARRGKNVVALAERLAPLVR